METERGEIRFPEISGEILEKVCQYMYYKRRHQFEPQRNVPPFDIPQHLALQLLMAANYLDV